MASLSRRVQRSQWSRDRFFGQGDGQRGVNRFDGGQVVKSSAGFTEMGLAEQRCKEASGVSPGQRSFILCTRRAPGFSLSWLHWR